MRPREPLRPTTRPTHPGGRSPAQRSWRSAALPPEALFVWLAAGTAVALVARLAG